MNRSILKTKAKNVLSKNYIAALLGCFIFNILVGQFGAQMSVVLTVLFIKYDPLPNVEQIGFTHSGTLPEIAPYVANIATFGLLFVFFVFLVGPLSVGKANFFIKAREETFKASSFFEIFKETRYTTALKAMFVRNILILTGWFLIIPGIYFRYALYFVPMIVADNPSISWKEALKTSMNMTKGHKFELFVLEISFLGWYILCSLLFIFCIYLVYPYYEATVVEAYFSLKEDSAD